MGRQRTPETQGASLDMVRVRGGLKIRIALLEPPRRSNRQA